MKQKTYTVHTKEYPTLSGLQHVVKQDGEQIAGFIKREAAELFATMLRQSGEICAS